jgi:hypothetical protein
MERIVEVKASMTAATDALGKSRGEFFMAL